MLCDIPGHSDYMSVRALDRNLHSIAVHVTYEGHEPGKVRMERENIEELIGPVMEELMSYRGMRYQSGWDLQRSRIGGYPQ
jgi:hypothetical protein